MNAVSLKTILGEEWHDMPLSSLCSYINRGSAPAYVDEGGLLVLNQKCVRDQRINLSEARRTDANRKSISHDRLLRLGDILVNSTGVGTLGRVAQVNTLPEPATVDSHVTIVRADPKRVEPRFLGLALRHLQPLIEALAEGSTGQTELARSELAALTVGVPSLPAQRAIAHILGTLDDKIELNRRTNQTLEAIARALFTSWFVAFDPVRAKATGRQPEGMDAATAALFPSAMIASELGQVPFGWQIESLSSVCTTQYGHTARATAEPVGPRFLRVTDINKRDWIEWQSVPYCSVTSKDRIKYALKPGDIVVARMADPGKAAIIDQEVDSVFASYLVRLQTPDLAHAHYVFRFLKSDSYRDYAAGAKSGSVQANMNAQVIVGARLVIPDAAVLHAFFSLVLPLRQKITSNNQQSETIANLRDTLLPRLLSGELRVPDAARRLAQEPV